MEKLQLQLLGVPVVTYVGQPVTFRSRRALALLIYLAVEEGFHTRDQLAALLWPDREQTHSRMLLRSAIALLRNGLHTVGFDSECALVLEQDRLRLNRGVIKLDLDMLEEAEQLLERSVGADVPKVEDIAARLREAIVAYRSDFLGEFTLDDAQNFDEWVTVQRERCHWRMHQIFEQLTLQYCHEGNRRAAFQFAARWVDHDPLHEPAHARLIQCHIEAGDSTAALRAFEQCRAVFERELGSVPSSETAALVVRLVSASTALLSQAVNPLTTQNATNHDLQQLQYAFKHLHEGQAKVALIERTHASKVLLVEFVDWVKQQNADILFGRAYNLGGRVPYQVLIDALRVRIEQERAPDDLLPDVWLSELSCLLPDLRDRYPDLAVPPADSATHPMRLYEAVFRLTSALAKRRPLIWLIEDVQHADGTSLDLLHYLVRRWDADHVPAMLIATTDTTSHTGAEYRAPAIARWITQLGRDVPVTLLRSPVVPLGQTQQAYQVLAA